jgi:hypothetical protein
VNCVKVRQAIAAIKSVSKLFPLPENAHISLHQVLDDDWFPSDLMNNG